MIYDWLIFKNVAFIVTCFYCNFSVLKRHVREIRSVDCPNNSDIRGLVPSPTVPNFNGLQREKTKQSVNLVLHCPFLGLPLYVSLTHTVWVAAGVCPSQGFWLLRKQLMWPAFIIVIFIINIIIVVIGTV